MIRNGESRVLRVPKGARSFSSPEGWGWLFCILIPVVSGCFLQGQPWAMLTTQALAENQLHTLWTGHLLHYTLEHYVWDALMFVGFACLLWREERGRLWLWLFLAAPLISIVVFRVDPGLSEYRGLSALDSMLFTRYCLGIAVFSKGWDRWLFGCLPLAALTGKIIYELTAGTALFVSDLGPGVVPLPSAHIAGMLLGCIWMVTVCVSKKRRRSGIRARGSRLDWALDTIGREV